MVVKYWYRIDKNGVGTKGPFQCDKDEIKNLVKYGKDFMWLRVQLPDGAEWFKADYVAGGRWVQIKRAEGN